MFCKQSQIIPYKVMFMVSMPGMEATVNAQGLEHVKTWVGFESTEISCPLSGMRGIRIPQATCPSSGPWSGIHWLLVAHPRSADGQIVHLTQRGFPP